MKRSRIVTFKIKENPKDNKTSEKYHIGDFFSMDFDLCLTDLERKGFIFYNGYKFYPNEVYIIRVMYIDKYNVDPDDEINEFNKFVN